jgi:hypothetical protein
LLELNCRLKERFNVNCFAAPPIGDLEVKRVSMPAFALTALTTTALTTSISRCSRKLRSQKELVFRFEFFNLFNHPQFGFPGTNFVSGSSNGFGQVTSQLNNPRLIQFALKFQF